MTQMTRQSQREMHREGRHSGKKKKKKKSKPGSEAPSRNKEWVGEVQGTSKIKRPGSQWPRTMQGPACLLAGSLVRACLLPWPQKRTPSPATNSAKAASSMPNGSAGPVLLASGLSKCWSDNPRLFSPPLRCTSWPSQHALLHTTLSIKKPIGFLFTMLSL